MFKGQHPSFIYLATTDRQPSCWNAPSEPVHHTLNTSRSCRDTENVYTSLSFRDKSVQSNGLNICKVTNLSGLYSADNELLAVAKLSEPIKKMPGSEVTLRVRLDY